ncbi:MAG TPA: LuxR C-terminal-related transcriptional regulator [Alphaproteobacteria bacterium]|nr:LuxR C-terminal-related transcriptional regulator [Alphaproteobacteria bacterium]
MDLDTFSRVTSGIYEAAVEPAAWPRALDSIVALFRGRGAALVARDMRSMAGHWICTYEPEVEREFFGPWKHRNVFANLARAPRPSAVETDQQMLPKRELLRSDYYNGFLRPLDFHSVLILWLKRRGSVQPSLSIVRARKAGEFDAADVELGRLLLPHLQRAVQLELRLGHLNLAEGGAAAALDLLLDAVIIIDEGGHPVFCNAAAERLLAEGDGLALEDGRFSAATSSLTARLEAIVAKAIGCRREAPAGGAMLLPRRSSPSPLRLVAVPLRRPIDWLAPRRPAACLCVADPDREQGAARWASAMFKLTAAEVEILDGLLAGHEAREIGDRLGISYNTVRVHLAHIMAKTGTRRQAELIRLLMTLPAIGTIAGLIG